MLPDNVLSTREMPSTFLYPDGIVNNKLTEDYEMGGVALQNPSQGLRVKPWYGFWETTDNTVYLKPDITGTPVAIFEEADVFELAFSFDQNMRWVAGTFTTDGTFRLRWYDSSVANYVITVVNGLTSFRLCHDDTRAASVSLGFSDVLLTYIRNNNLYVRIQRERYGGEHLLQSNLPDNLRITNFGMSERQRVQWRLRYRRPKELLPWLT